MEARAERETEASKFVCEAKTSIFWQGAGMQGFLIPLRWSVHLRLQASPGRV